MAPRCVISIVAPQPWRRVSCPQADQVKFEKPRLELRMEIESLGVRLEKRLDVEVHRESQSLLA